MSHKKSNIPLIASLEGHSGRILSVAFHLTAPLLATGSEDGTVKLWDTDSQQCVGTLVGHTNIVRSVAFHPTAPVLISGSTDKTLKVWDTTTYQCLSTTQAHKYGVTCLAFHPSESYNGHKHPRSGGYRYQSLVQDRCYTVQPDVHHKQPH